MFRFLRFILHLIAFIAIGALAFFVITVPSTVVDMGNQALSVLETPTGQFAVLGIVIVYYVVFVLSYVEKLFKKKKEIKVKGPNGVIEVSVLTIEDITRNFLESTDIIKNVKTKVTPTWSSAEIEALVECYKTDNLNEKLKAIKERLNDYILKMVGFKPKKINIKVSKINQENAVETISSETNPENVTEVEDTNVEL